MLISVFLGYFLYQVFQVFHLCSGTVQLTKKPLDLRLKAFD